jgi:hypothetical protein
MAAYATHIDGLVHEPTQTDGDGVDLTVAEVYETTDPGAVDFGGDELAPAATVAHESAARDPDDEYEWWSLDSGTYLLEYNESVAGADLRFTVQTREAVLERGAFHPTLHVTALPRVPLSVGAAGLRLKENARVSTVVDADPI